MKNYIHVWVAKRKMLLNWKLSAIIWDNVENTEGWIAINDELFWFVFSDTLVNYFTLYI